MPRNTCKQPRTRTHKSMSASSTLCVRNVIRWSMDDAVRYRTKAEECRLLSKQMGLIEHRDALLEMAKEWDALAAQLESRIAKRDVPAGGSAEDA